VILLTILARRFPFFHSADDIDAVIELGTVFGRNRMKLCALLHGQVFESNIPTVTENGYTMEKIIMWSTNTPGRDNEGNKIPLPDDEQLAVDFLNRCFDLDTKSRITAQEALEHDFLTNIPPPPVYLDHGW
jgi:cell division control protein 7